MVTLLWFTTVIGWLVIPVISFFVNKLLSYLYFNLSRKLRELELQIIPSLKLVLGDITEQRVLRGAKDEEGKGSESDLKILGERGKDFKAALCDAEGILDLVEYRRTEKKVIGGGVLQAIIGDWIACCKRSSFGRKLWQCAQNQYRKLGDLGEKLQHCAQDLDLQFWDLVAKLQQYAQAAQYLDVNRMFRDSALRNTLMQFAWILNMYNHQGAAGQPPRAETPVAEFTVDIEQRLATPSSTPDVAPSNPLSPNAPPNSAGSATEFRGDNQHGSSEEAPMLDAATNSLVHQNSAGSATEFRGDNEHASTEEAPLLDAAMNSLVQIAWDCFGFVFAQLFSFYLAVLHLRDWSWEAVGIKNDDDTATDWVLSINELISTRKRINNIEYIVSESQKTPLLNQNGTTTTIKNSDKESSIKRKEIDDLYGSIKQKVFGRDKDCEHISRMLHERPVAFAATFSASKPYSVIGIYGISGSGKSTLAQYVCDHEKVAGHFDPVMFIRVEKIFSVANIFRDMLEEITKSQKFSVVNIFRDMVNIFRAMLEKITKSQTFSVVNIFRDTLEKITNSRPSNDKDLKSLKKELEEMLKDKCFLLVLDDLWVNDENQKELDILLDMLRLSAVRSGSRVLVTAQKADAAGALGAHVQPFSIPDLEEEVYLSLLMHHAGPFASDDEYRKYENTGRKIANRLCRSPIAAVTVGKRLQRNKSISFWETTSKLDVLNETMGALWWSYQQLGVDIRRCFAYCSTFPRGYRLERDELVRIWIAQGFVNNRSKGTEELEDVGQRYCDELLTFSFLQGRWTDVVKKTETLTIHDLLHELAERVSGSEFFRIGLNGSPEDIPRGVHHLFIETTNGVKIAEKLVEVENLRTLIIKEPAFAAPLKFSRGRNHDSEKLLERLFMKLTKLRVLIIEQNGFAEELSVPACIDRMKHLRYLGLRFHHVMPVLILPNTFSKLYHIEIIDIPLYEASLPEDMANLIFLRHIPDWLAFPNIGRLTSLRTMGSFIVKEEQGYELKQLKHLNQLGGTLKIEGLGIIGSKEEALEAQLTNKKRLKKLILYFGRDKRFGADVEAEVLEGLCPPKNLEELRIDDFGVSRYPRWMLSRHHPDAPKKLYRLELWRCSSQLASIPDDSEVLTGLRQLEIYRCGWDRLPENMERLMSLETLEICNCNEIELLPTLPHQCLDMITIVRCGVLSATCKVERHHNWHKIQHIRRKRIM